MSCGDRSETEFPIWLKMKPTLRVLQIFGLFPQPLEFVERSSSLKDRDHFRNRKTKNPGFQHTGKFCLFKLYSLGLCAANVWFFYMCVNTIVFFRFTLKLDLLHALVVVPIVTSLKPIIAGVHFLIFCLYMKEHKELYKHLETVHQSFSAGLYPNCSPEILKKINSVMIAILGFALLFGFLLAIGEHAILEKRWAWANLIVFIGVPLLTAWNILPLIYFNQIHWLIRNWIATLNKAIGTSSHDVSTQFFPVKECFKYFSQLADLQNAVSNFFNPYIAFSFVWSIFTLCLTIYFLVNAGESFSEAPAHLFTTPNDFIIWERAKIFHIFWIFLQTTVALIHFISLCDTGRKSNEKTRNIVETVLTGIQKHTPEITDYIFIHCFELKIRLQSTWGSSVWRAIPLERHAFIQITTIIISYAILLVKFRQNIGSPHSRDFSFCPCFINNSTALGD